MHCTVSRLWLFCTVFIFKTLTENFAVESNKQYFEFDGEPDVEKSSSAPSASNAGPSGQQEVETTKNRIFIRHKKYQKLNKIICEKLGCAGTFVKSSIRENQNAENSIGTGRIELSRGAAQEFSMQRHKKEATGSGVHEEHLTSHTQERNNMESRDSDVSTTFVSSVSKVEQTSSEKNVPEKLHTTSSPKLKSEDERILEQKANEHYDRMTKEAICKIPTPTLIKVNEIYHHPHKNYYPPCTKIHRCSEESGCCFSTNKTCLPYKTQNVTLQFKVLIRKPGNDNPIKKYESLIFLNHTECRCKYVNDQLLADEPVPADPEQDFPQSLNFILWKKRKILPAKSN